MTYQPQPGDYGLVKTKGAIGFLIQLAELTQFNHVVIYLGDGLIAEAKPRGGVQISHVEDYQNIAWNQHEAKTPEQRVRLVVEARARLGEKYSFIDFTAILYCKLGLRVPNWLTNYLKNSLHTICSQYGVRVYRASGFTIESKREDFLIEPSDLAYRLLYF